MSSVILTYSKLITTTVANQAVNLTESGTLGHRVQCPMSVDDLNRFFIWHRPAGVQAPIGHFTAHEDTPGSSFSYILANTLSKYYTDIDGVSNGLNFGSAILDANLDPNIREDGKISSNDLIMAYVIYKLYGSSASPTQNVIFNLQDAYGMLTNSTLISSIETSLRTEEASPNSGAVNEMFQDLLSQDPTRFFDAAGKQIPGLFEVNTPTPATGPWNFVENDRIELNIQFTFSNPVTMAASPTAASVATTISAGTTFKIRLQLLATNTPTAASALITTAAEAKAQELLRQAEEQQEAAEAAEVAAAAAAQAEATAAKQAASLQATYTAAITRNGEQEKAVLSAQAAVQAAQTALAAATISGNQANIQQQNAAAVAAQTLLTSQQAIATQVAADLQNAAYAVAKAIANVNATQTVAAQAAAQAAAANAKKAKDALDLELATAQSLQSTIAAATAASDPFTQALEQEKEAILDPQNLVTIMAKANAATKTRQTAFNTMLQNFAKQTEQLNTYITLTDTMNSAIATGSNLSQLQLVNSMVIGASNLVNKATAASQNAASTLVASYSAEINAIQRGTMASSNAASLASVVAAANTNSANKSLTTVTTAYVYASTVNANAAAAAADAQNILNNRVANGAPMNEIKTRTKALLDANAIYAATTSTLYGNQAKLTLATQAYQAASTIAVDAKANISSVAASNLFAVSVYQTSVSTSSAYQANVMYNAKLNQLASQVNTGLIKLTQANSAVAVAKANVSLAQLKINMALSSGNSISELTVLNDIYAKANDSLTQALLIQTTAQAAYDAKTQNATNSQVQLLQQNAMAYFNASITQQQIATDSINSYSTLVSYATQDPAAFPPINGIPSAELYSTQLGVWQTYLGNFQTLAGTLLTQFNKDLTSASTLMAANPAISTSIGALSNYYTASSNSSHLAFQVNILSTFFTSFSTVGYDASDDLANYSSQYSSAVADTAAAYSSNLAASLEAQISNISSIKSAGQTILLAAQAHQLAQISTATVNSKINEYNASVSTLSMIQLRYDQASVAATTAGQALSNAAITTSQGQFILYQRRYADAVAALSALANELNGSSKAVSTLGFSLGVRSSSDSVTSPIPNSIPGLQLWLDANDPLLSGSAPVAGTTITTWYDKSPNSYNAMATGSPVIQESSLNSLPGIAFVGNTAATNYYTARIPPNTFSNAITFFVVYKNTADNGANALLTRSFVGNSIGAPDIYNTNIVITNTSSEYGYNGYQGTSSYSTTPSLFQVTIDQVGDAVYQWITGTAQGVSYQGYGPLTASTGDASNNRLYIGTRGDNGTSFQGVFYEILVYNMVLSTTDREKIEGYLAWKWGLQANLPADHRYLSAAPPSGITSGSAPPSRILKPSVPNPKLWLDASDPLGTGTAPADGTQLTTWADKSGNGYDGSVPSSNQYSPCDPFVTYDASNSSINMSNGTLVNSSIPPGTFVNAFNMFMVYNCTDYTWYNSIISRGSSTIRPEWGNPVFVYGNSVHGVVQLSEVTLAADGPLPGGFHYSGGGNTSWFPYNTTLNMANIDIDFLTNNINIIGNGNFLEQLNSSPSGVLTDLGDTVTIGGRTDGYAYANISVKEVMLFNTELTELQRKEVEGYLATKWGLQANLPAGHPYSTTRNSSIRFGSDTSQIPVSVLNTYSKATMLRQSELAVAQTNALIQQANSAYNNYSQLNDKLEAANQSTSSIIDEISVAMAKGANLATIQPLQTKLSAIQENTATLQIESANVYNTFLTLSTLVSPDYSFISSVNSASNATFSATMGARLNESAQQLQIAQVENSAAATAAAQANAALTVISTQFSIQKQQGLSSAQMAPLTSTLTAASLDSANKNILLNFANAALAQAQANYSSLQSYPSIYTSFANVSTNIAKSFSTLSAGQAAQITSLTQAKSNALTSEITNAYIGSLHYSTLVQADYTHYDDLLVKYNTQMAAGGAPASTYSELTTAYNKYVTNKQKEILYSAAYLSTMTMATLDPSSVAILSAVASNQTKAIEGAKANELYKNLEAANTHLFTLNNEFVSIQSAYAVANSDLQIATANNSAQAVLDIKYSTLIGRANELNNVQIKYNLAQTAVQYAQNNVATNPNAQGILDTATAKYLEQANLSQANLLVAQYDAAVANEKKTYAALQTANAALKSAQATFTSVIAAGADLATIKAARDAQSAAATAVTQAGLIEENAMNALNQALQNANLDQIAQSLIITARLTNENTTAGGAVNAAQAQLNVLSTVVAAAETTLTNAKAASVAATSTVQASLTTKTVQEITELQAAAIAASAAASSAQLAFAAAMSNFMAEATTVSSLTQTFSTTTAALTLNTNRNTLLYNGFEYNQTFDRYVLKRSYLPAQVIDGSPFNLYSVTVNPIDMGVYNPSTSYVLGNLVYYPNSDGTQYMAGIATDPRD